MHKRSKKWVKGGVEYKKMLSFFNQKESLAPFV